MVGFKTESRCSNQLDGAVFRQIAQFQVGKRTFSVCAADRFMLRRGANKEETSN